MTVFEIPLHGTPQRFAITLGGVPYTLTFQFRNAGPSGQGGTWVLDLGDAADNPLACGLPLVPGCDLLGEFAYLGFPGQLWVVSDGNPAAMPTFAGLGITSHLYFVLP